MKSIYALILILSSLIYGQGMTMDAFIDTLVERHPLFVAEDYAAKIAEAERQGALSYLDWSVSGGPYYSYSQPMRTSSFGAEEVTALGINVNAEKIVEWIGGKVSGAFSTGYTDQQLGDITIPMSPEPMVISSGPSYYYSNSISMSYTQPLLQNYRGNLNRLGYDLGQYSVEMAQLQAVENKESFVQSMTMRYIDWALMVEQIDITQTRLELAEKQLERTQRMRDANLIDIVDVLRAEDAVRMARQSLVLLQSQEEAVREELSVIISCEKLCHSRPDFDLYSMEELPELEVVGDSIRASSRLIATMEKQTELLNRRRESYIELNKPILNLDLGAGLHKADGEFAESWILDRPQISMSLLYVPNVGRSDIEADIRANELEMELLNSSIEQTAVSLEATARNLLVQIRNMEKVLELNREQIESSELRTAEEIKLWERGRGQLNFVIQSRDSEQNARFTYAQNAANYHKLVLQFRALMDELYTESIE